MRKTTNKLSPEVRDLRQANEILRKASSYFAQGEAAQMMRGKTARATISDRAATCSLDHLNRQFHAPAPNRLWLSVQKNSKC